MSTESIYKLEVCCELYWIAIAPCSNVTQGMLCFPRPQGWMDKGASTENCLCVHWNGCCEGVPSPATIRRGQGRVTKKTLPQRRTNHTSQSRKTIPTPSYTKKRNTTTHVFCWSTMQEGRSSTNHQVSVQGTQNRCVLVYTVLSTMEGSKAGRKEGSIGIHPKLPHTLHVWVESPNDPA